MNQQTTVNHKPSAANDQASILVGQQTTAPDPRSPLTAHRLLLTDYRSLITDYWSLLTNYRSALPAILITFTLLGLLYDFTVPFFEKPDELKHFAVIQYIQTQHRLPVIEVGIHKTWDQEGTQPPLYHLLAALAVSWLDLSDFQEPPRNPHYADDRSFVWRERGNNNLYLHAPGETWRLEPIFTAARLSRWLSLLAGLGTLILTHRLAQLIFIPNSSSQPGKPKNSQFTHLQLPTPAPPSSTPIRANLSPPNPPKGGESEPIPPSGGLGGQKSDLKLAQMSSTPNPSFPIPNSQFPIPNPPTPNLPIFQSSNLPSFHPSTLLPPLAAALIAFIPQFLHVSSAITNDSLSVTLAAAALLILVSILKNGRSTRYAVCLGLVLGLGAITKLSLLYLVPLAGLILLLDLRRHRSISRLFSDGLIIGGLMGLLAGWWYWRNWQLYGDITALNAHLLYRGGALDPRPSLVQIWQTEITGLELSFWAAFGAGQILLEPWLYEILRWIKYLVFVGLAIGFWRLFTAQPSAISHQPLDKQPEKKHSPFTIHNSQFTILLLLLLWTLIIFIALLRWMQITPASWGRLLYPTLPALGVLAAWGVSHLRFAILRLGSLRLHSGQAGQVYALRITYYVLRITHHVLRATPLILLTFLFCLSLLSPFRYIRAAYAKTPLVAETEISEDINRLHFIYDDAMRLLGYKIEQATIRPGEWLPLTLYWQAIRPLDKNYSVFVHLLDDNGQAIAQANTYPDGGKWPASMLPPGQALKDTYYVFVPSEAEAAAPLATRLALGIFEFDDPERAAKVAVDPAGQVIEPIVVGPPLLPRQWPEPNPAQPLEVTFAGQIRLIGYDWVNQNIAPGQQLPLTFYWQTLTPPGQNLNLFIHLIDPTTQTQLAGFDAPPRYPTAFWQPGNIIVDSRRLTLPADLPPGDYELRLGWYNLETLARLETPGGDSLSLLTLSVRP